MIPDDLQQDIPNNGMPQNAVSIYGQNDSADDFPVLKAFQEYINAEQEKARKRLLTICSFFAIFLFLVVAVFVFLLWDSGRRKDMLYDRLIQSIEDRSRATAQMAAQTPAPAPAPVVVQQPVATPAPAPAKDPEQTAALKAVADALAALKKDVEEQKRKNAEEKSPTQLAVEKRNREDTDKLLRERARLDAEKRHLADEKEKLRQAEIERQRRRLYPDYYDASGNPKKPDQKSAAATPAKPAAAKPVFSDKDIQDILVEADEGAVEYFSESDENDGTKEKSKTAKQKKSAPKKKPAKAKAEKDEEKEVSAEEEEEDDPSYDGDDYKLRVKGKDKGSSWDIPLSSSSSSSSSIK